MQGILMLIISLILILIQTNSGNSDREACCQKGREHAELEWKNRLEKGKNPSEICSKRSLDVYFNKYNKTTYRSRICSIIAKSCCINTSKKEVCNLGATQSPNCESLDEESSFIMNQIKMECCLCCQENKIIFDSCKVLPEKCSREADSRIKILLTATEVPFVTTLNTSDCCNTKNVSITIPSNNSSIQQVADNDTKFSNTSDIALDSFNTTENETIDSEAIVELDNSTDEWKTDTLTTATPSSTFQTSARPSGLSTKGFWNQNQRTSINPGLVCGKSRKWDSQRQVCVQFVISCPKLYILHPETNRCVPIIQPKVPCTLGYKYNQFKDACIDFDECENNFPCSNKTELCVNTIGSYQCNCYDGFKHNKAGSCEDIDECNNSSICTENKKCKNTVGSYRCIRSVSCGFGWKEDPETGDCVDVDECELFAGICGPGMKCVNIRGSHQCEDDECPINMKRNNKGTCSKCKDGYKFVNKTGNCEDIDECNLNVGWYNGHCKDTEVCFNLPGSYECIPKKKCRPGTILTKNGTECEDVDECKQRRFRCEPDEICLNTFSSYQCVSSPCAPSQQYDYTINKCVCRDGYRLGDANVCSDIDECSDNGAENLCGTEYICVNHPGGYNCIHKAECPSGLFRSSMYSSCQDIDECETGEGKCPQNMYCVNMVGSYKCMCNRGYIMMQNNTCADVNECLLFRPEESCPDLEARCVNTAGSYKCQCPKGFQWTEYPIKKCTDINECLRENPCGRQHKCINTIGSYKCKCFQGYRLAASGDHCEDIDECLLETKKCVNGFCVNLPGRYSCRCPPGFAIDKKEICQDIDECTTFGGGCPIEDQTQASKMCINLFGYYKCVSNNCPEEYTKRETGNGFICILNQKNGCPLKDMSCLLQKPYRKIYEFIEISHTVNTPHIISRINTAHLPPGISRIKLQVKYAKNTNTKEPISVQNVFKLIRSRYIPDNIEIVMKQMVPVPAEILLYFEVNKYHQDMYFGHSHALMHIYFTKYPLSAK